MDQRADRVCYHPELLIPPSWEVFGGREGLKSKIARTLGASQTPDVGNCW